jgi:SAM-dependent methyltransferase
VAYWNLAQRRVRRVSGQWTVNGQPLRFFHFSGNLIEDRRVFARHSTQFNTDNIGETRDLLDIYRDAMTVNGHAYYVTQSYGFSWGGAARQNEHTPEGVAQMRLRSAANRPHLPLLRSRSRAEFDQARSNLQRLASERSRIEIDSIPAGTDAFVLTGFCACCGKEAEFQVSAMYSSRRLDDGRVFPNWREHLDCLECGLVNRVRASLHVLLQEFAPRAIDRIYITEQVTPTYRWLKERFPNTTGSEFFGDDHKPGSIIDGVLHQDVQCLSFAPNSFDFLLTYDVLEHVPDHRKALKEFFRVLAPGGRLMITAPFSFGSSNHKVLAERGDDGTIVHFAEPEYHGNPVDMEQGALCFRYFGWDLLDELSEAGFSVSEVVSYWSEQLLHFGDPQIIIVASKSGLIQTDGVAATNIAQAA